MTASSTTVKVTQRRMNDRQFGRSVRVFRAVATFRARWSAFASAGQLGVMDEARLGRHTGARI